jgi:hypothetical protein
VVGCDRVSINSETDLRDLSLYVCVELWHAGDPIARPIYTHIVPFSRNPRWNVWLECLDMPLLSMPIAARLCVTLFVRPFRRDETLLQSPNASHDEVSRIATKDTPLGWVNIQLVDFDRQLKKGVVSLNMWPNDRANPIAPAVNNVGSEDALSLTVEFGAFALPVVYPTDDPPFCTDPPLDPGSISPEEKEAVAQLLVKDPLHRLSLEEKTLMWCHREYCSNYAKALPKFVSAIPWTHPGAVFEGYRMIRKWAPLEPVDALALLDTGHADPFVREYAVERLEFFSDDKLQDFLLQLTQALKYEPYHYSPLTLYLLRRGLNSPYYIGHILFWHLKAEMHVAHVAERFGLILEEYLRSCGDHRKDLLKQHSVEQQLFDVAMTVKQEGKSVQEKVDVLRKLLREIELPSSFKLPLSPRLECRGIIVEKCKVMDSKKLPLWLTFENADPRGKPIVVIYKAGDDLRQDLLTLQMLRIMDKSWKEAGMDLKLIPYGCVPTGDGIGFIEVVVNSATTAAITREAGGARAAFREDPIANWIRKHNKTDEQYDQAVDLFIPSCAGYCIATYVLGIGDRHNDNVMITKSGNLFHIDFGHFLGNFKTFAGFKRETAPFVFTPDFCFVMGGTSSAQFKSFVDLCGRAYNVVRRRGHMFINLFQLMLSTGIPELQREEDILYLRERIKDELSDEDGMREMEQKIHLSLKNKRLQLNNYIHIMAHN